MDLELYLIYAEQTSLSHNINTDESSLMAPIRFRVGKNPCDDAL